MKPEWKIAGLSGLGGALVAVAIVFAAADNGLLTLRTNGDAIRDYMMAHPELVTVMQEKLDAQQEEAADEARQHAVDKLGVKVFFDPRFAFVTGPANAKHTVVEFFDYNCPYCRASIPAIRKFYAQHKNDTRFAFIEFPIKGPQSTLAARAALAARKQPAKYLDFHFALMGGDDLLDQGLIDADARKAGLDPAELANDMRAPNIDTAIAEAHSLADAAKIDGTPVFIVNGKIREGAVDDGILSAMAKS